MANVADKVVRVEPDVYEFVADFANDNDLKISEATSLFLRYCMGKSFDLVKKEVTLIENITVLEESHGRS